MNKWESIKHNYIDRGIKIIPIIPNGKTPLIEKWNEDLSSDYWQILYWYESNHEMNIGIPCLENNLFVLDLDKHDAKKDGVDNFKKLCDFLSIDIPQTLIQETPSGGLHYIFKSDEDLKEVKGVANAFSDYPGIDIRNRNYIVSEPSLINGKKYEFINNTEVKDMPRELKNYILSNVKKVGDSHVEYQKPSKVAIGDRDNQLFLYITDVYYKTRLDYDEVLCLARHFNEEVLDDPLPDKVVIYKTKKAFQKPRDKMIYVVLHE